MELTPWRELSDIVSRIQKYEGRNRQEENCIRAKLFGLSGRVNSLFFAGAIALDYANAFPSGMFQEMQQYCFSGIVEPQYEPEVFFMMEGMLLGMYALSCMASVVSGIIERKFKN